MELPSPTGGRASAEFMFADRVGESVALARSLANHKQRVRRSTIDPNVGDNVLTFHGMGGVGKTKLSQRLEDWLRRVPGDYAGWGLGPGAPGDKVLTVRWDLNNSRGNVDIVGLLVALRAGLVGSQIRWRAFDLAFAAYVSAVDPGESLNMRGFQDFSGDLLDVLGGLASELELPGWAGSLSTVALRPLLEKAAASITTGRALNAVGALKPALEACARLQARDPSPTVAAQVAWVLNDEIDSLPAEERPLLVVFIDTFERVQSGDALAAEAAINRLVAHLPYALFVITGRDSVRWHEPSRTNLDFVGARRWPSLVRGPAEEEPRQHLVGRLSDADALTLFRMRRAAGRWPMDEALLPALVTRTAGLPLHMDAVCKHADNLTSDGATAITDDDVVRDLGDLVRRIVQDLTDEQARAFHAACLLPYFDVALAAAVGQVSEAAVEGCTRRALVEDNPSSRYPHRVHDRIRELVRSAGSDVKGGWADADWRDAAQRGFREAQRRHDEAAASEDDRATMEAIGLGLTLAVEYDLPGGWLADAIKLGPTIRGLASLAPPVPGARATTDGVAFCQLIRALNAPSDPATPVKLREILDGPTVAASQAGTWLAYRLRGQSRHDEARAVLLELLDRFPDRTALLHNQYSVTLRMQRRFVEALDYRSRNGLPDAMGPYLRYHGHDTRDAEARFDQARNTPSRRFAFERYTEAVSHESRFRPVPQAVVASIERRAVNLGAPEREADAWIIRGYQYLHHDQVKFDEVIERLIAIGRRQSRFGRASVARLLALRARATGSAEYADRAAAEAAMAPERRPASWIFTDFAMELIGRPLPDVPTQWLEPVDDVRARWYAVIDSIIERSRNGQIVVP